MKITTALQNTFDPRTAAIYNSHPAIKALAITINTLSITLLGAYLFLSFSDPPLRKYTPLHFVSPLLIYLTTIHQSALLAGAALTSYFAHLIFMGIQIEQANKKITQNRRRVVCECPPPPPLNYNEKGHLVLKVKGPVERPLPTIFYGPHPYNPRLDAEIALSFKLPKTLEEALTQDSSWINEIDESGKTHLDRFEDENEIYSILRKYGAKKAEELILPLHLAVMQKNLFSLQKILNSGINPNELDDSCTTALDQCENDRAMSSRLIDKGGRKAINLMPLWHYLVRRQDLSAIKLCLQFPEAQKIIHKKPLGEFDERDQFGKTPLEYIKKGSEIEKYLTEKGYIQVKETDCSHGSSSDDEKVELPEA
ncbi:MAG: hypothetical protein ChlgKO_08650 [Chlamydiales bacterium]